MSMSKDLRVSYRETLIALACTGCGAEALVDLGESKQQQKCVDDRPLSCGVCGVAMDSNLRSAVQSLARAWGSMKAMEQQAAVHFHMRVDEARGR
jgi:hypothetical protein